MVTSLHPPTQTWNQLDLHDSLYPAEVDFDSMSLTLGDTLNTMDCIVFPCNRLDRWTESTSFELR